MGSKTNELKDELKKLQELKSVLKININSYYGSNMKIDNFENTFNDFNSVVNKIKSLNKKLEISSKLEDILSKEQHS